MAISCPRRARTTWRWPCSASPAWPSTKATAPAPSKTRTARPRSATPRKRAASSATNAASSDPCSPEHHRARRRPTLGAMEIYLVGGAVRDALMSPENAASGPSHVDRDWVVVGATPEAMVQQGFLPVGRDFPVFLHPQTREEYALARTERKTAPGYRGFAFHTEPGVTLEDDLARRDLTINAMAVTQAEADDPAGARLIDPYGGQQDLRDRVLRHVTHSFAEDPVRILGRAAARRLPPRDRHRRAPDDGAGHERAPGRFVARAPGPPVPRPRQGHDAGRRVAAPHRPRIAQRGVAQGRVRAPARAGGMPGTGRRGGPRTRPPAPQPGPGRRGPGAPAGALRRVPQTGALRGHRAGLRMRRTRPPGPFRRRLPAACMAAHRPPPPPPA